MQCMGSEAMIDILVFAAIAVVWDVKTACISFLVMVGINVFLHII
jgi:hypothetical protein